MNIEYLRDYCLKLPFSEEKFPFDDSTLVFCVGGRIFALVNLENGSRVNLKCNPERALVLRDTYAGVIPGWHMNKKHWNTVLFDADVPDKMLLEFVFDSYNLVCIQLPKRIKDTLK